MKRTPLTMASTARALGLAPFGSFVVAACGGGGDSDSTRSASTMGCSGLATGDTVVMLSTGAAAVFVSNIGSVALTTLAGGTAYTVPVGTQPGNPAQIRLLANPNGSTGAAIVTVSVACTNNIYPAADTVTCLTGNGMMVQITGASIPVASGSSSFSTSLAYGEPKSFTIKTQPSNPTQTCVVANPSGTVHSARSRMSMSPVRPRRTPAAAMSATCRGPGSCRTTMPPITLRLRPITPSVLRRISPAARAMP